jgi:hypothetical protein
MNPTTLMNKLKEVNEICRLLVVTIIVDLPGLHRQLIFIFQRHELVSAAHDRGWW